MGDCADYDIEQGESLVNLHETGMCGEVGPCPYCEDETTKTEGSDDYDSEPAD